MGLSHLKMPWLMLRVFMQDQLQLFITFEEPVVEDTCQ